jgi:response regulator RpfG family c-di-GMP phosphodiesterase
VTGRTLIVHGSAATLLEIRDHLLRYVQTDEARTAEEVVRRLSDPERRAEYAVVIVDARHPDLTTGHLLAQISAGAPDALLILLGALEEEVGTLEELAPGRIFRFFGGPGEWWQLAGTVREALRLYRLEREQAELIHKLYGEYAKLQKREKLLDVVVKERTRNLEEALDHLRASARQAILGFAEAIEAKDAYTKGHCGRVAVYSLTLAQEARLPPEEMEHIEFGGFLHDIGKIGVRDAVLLKPGPLDEQEWSHMRVHPVMGYQIASQIELLKPVMPCVRNHHERWDGTGYPDNLRGEDIPLMARIVCLADAFDAMATDRPYKRAMSPDECEKAMRRQAGVQFDPELVEIFIRRGIARLFQTGSS